MSINQSTCSMPGSQIKARLIMQCAKAKQAYSAIKYYINVQNI